MKRNEFTVDVSKAEADVLEERDRQARKWTAEHDDHYTDGSLARAAGLVATVTALGSVAEDAIDPECDGGTWVASFVKKCIKKYRSSKRQRYVIAAAMLIAEVERMDRESLKTHGPNTAGDVR